MPNLIQLTSGMTMSYSFIKVGTTIEAANVMYSTFIGANGNPIGNGAPNPAIGINGATLTGSDFSTTITGRFLIPVPNADENVYLTYMEISSTPAVGEFIFADRLWHNAALSATSTTEQAITTPVWPARCPVHSGGYDFNSSGYNVMIAIEVSSATTTAAAQTARIRYTNSSGVSNRIGHITSFPGTAVAGTFLPFQLASGDVGVKSIEGFTLGATLSGGTIHLVAYRQFAQIGLPLNGVTARLDAVSLGRPALPSGAVPFLFYNTAGTTAQTTFGKLEFSIASKY